jgi:hypothetical protein
MCSLCIFVLKKTDKNYLSLSSHGESVRVSPTWQTANLIGVFCDPTSISSFSLFLVSTLSLSLSLSLSIYIYIYIYIYYCFWYFIKENITLFLLTTAISVSIFITWASKFKIRFPSAHFELPVFQVVFQFSLSKLSKSFGSCSLFSVFFCVVA